MGLPCEAKHTFLGSYLASIQDVALLNKFVL